MRIISTIILSTILVILINVDIKLEGNIKTVSVTQSLDIAESRKREYSLYEGIKDLNNRISDLSYQIDVAVTKEKL